MEGAVGESDSGWQRFSFFDFIVEFFGSLVPGIVFTTAAIFGLAWPLWAFVIAASSGQNSAALPALPSEIIKNVEWGALATMLCISYVLGHLFFRQDPNDPDRASFRRLKNELVNQQARLSDIKEREAPLEGKLRGEYACQTDADVRFPYRYLDEYLEQRGLNHLLWFVLWRDPGKGSLRSKNYINVLKIRLGFYQPGQCITIARNEAHVRLISSTWHLCGGLVLVSTAGIAMVLIRMLVLHGALVDRVLDSLALMLPPALVMAAAVYIRWKTEKPLHYMRLREIVFVLETAYTAFRREPHLIQDVFPGFTGDEGTRESARSATAMAGIPAEA